MKIRTWDKVEVIWWKDKGTRGEVLKVLTDKNRVIVKGVNIVTRHMKKMWTNPGQAIKMEKAVDASNVLLVCPFTDKATRVWFVTTEKKWKSNKFRFSKVAVKEQWKKPAEVIIK